MFSVYLFASLYQDVSSRSPSILSLKTGEQFMVELKKNSGSLGISVAVSELFSFYYTAFTIYTQLPVY